MIWDGHLAVAGGKTVFENHTSNAIDATSQFWSQISKPLHADDLKSQTYEDYFWVILTMTFLSTVAACPQSFYHRVVLRCSRQQLPPDLAVPYQLLWRCEIPGTGLCVDVYQFQNILLLAWEVQQPVQDVPGKTGQDRSILFISWNCRSPLCLVPKQRK